MTGVQTCALPIYQAAVVLRSLRRREGTGRHIEELVSTYDSVFKEAGIQTFVNEEDDKSGILRYPIVVPGIERGELLRETLNRGLYLETNYELPLPGHDEWSRFPNSLWAAKNVVLLPLYRRLSIARAEVIARSVAKLAKGAFLSAGQPKEEAEYAAHLG